METMVKVYEDNGGGLHAVVMSDGKVTNIISGFEDGTMNTADFIDAARYGFEGADSYYAGNYNEYSMEEVAAEMDASDDLIAEITFEDVALHINAMGSAGRRLLGICPD